MGCRAAPLSPRRRRGRGAPLSRAAEVRPPPPQLPPAVTPPHGTALQTPPPRCPFAEPPPPPALPITADLGTPAAPTRGAAQVRKCPLWGRGGQRPIAAPHQQPLCAPQMAAARLKFDFCAESPRSVPVSPWWGAGDTWGRWVGVTWCYSGWGTCGAGTPGLGAGDTENQMGLGTLGDMWGWGHWGHWVGGT